MAGWNLSVNSDHPSSLSLMRGPLDRYDEDFYDDDEEENGDVHFLYHSDDKTRRSDRSQVGLSFMSRQMLACTSPLPIGKSISNPACCIFPQPIKLVLYRGCLILQQSTKSATQCNAKQIKKIAVGLSGGKRTRLTIQQPRHVRILNFSSGFASLLRLR